MKKQSYIYHLQVRELHSHDSVEYTCKSIEELKKAVQRLHTDVETWETLRKKMTTKKGKRVNKNTYFIQVVRSKKEDAFRYTCFTFEHLLHGIQSLQREITKWWEPKRSGHD